MQHVLHEENGNGEVAIVLYSESITRILPSVSDINYDATFYVTPMHFYQLFCVHGLYQNNSFPLFFALMTQKSRALYSKIFQVLKETLPAFPPSKSMGDYEQASADALLEHFPTLETGHCQFHYSQCIWRKIQKAGLTTFYKENADFKAFAKKKMSLPYLNAQAIRPTADLLLQTQFKANDATKLKINQLKMYVTRFWLGKIGPEKMSVFNFENATNNWAESFHSRLRAIIKVHQPNFWSFLLNINNCIKDTMNDIKRVKNGLAISRPRKAKYAKNIQKREESKRKLAQNEITPIQFIAIVSHTFDPENIVAENLERLDMETEVDEEEEEQLQQPPPAGAPAAAANACVICLGERENTKTFLPCGHGGCGTCVDHITSAENATCPVCRCQLLGSVQAFL